MKNASFESWADYYDLVDGDRSEMIAFYKSMALESTTSVLELACGTGLVAAALASHLRAQGKIAARVVGIDISPSMLNIARVRDKECSWLVGDMRSPDLDEKFDLVFCCYNSLQHMLSDADIGQVFSAVRDLLAAEGRFVFDLYQPNESYLKNDQVNRLVRAVRDREGQELELYEDAHYDPLSRIYVVDWRLKPAGMHEILATFRQHHRQYPAAEIRRLLARAGLRPMERYGDFQRSPQTDSAKKQIIVAGLAEKP